MGAKYCTRCEACLPITEFHKQKAMKDGYRNWCKDCCRDYQRENKTKHAKGNLKWRINNYGKYMYNYTKKSALKRGKIFDIDFDKWCQAYQETIVCPLLGIELFKGERGLGVGKRRPDKISIDRLDNSKGYTNDNFWFVSWRANELKRDATLEELQTLADNLKEALERLNA